MLSALKMRAAAVAAATAVADLMLASVASPAGHREPGHREPGHRNRQRGEARQPRAVATPDFGGPALSITYARCDPGIARVLRAPIGSSDNRPPEGCRVVLRSSMGGQHVLCEGRAQVPPGWFPAPGPSLPLVTVVIGHGDSSPCFGLPVAAA